MNTSAQLARNFLDHALEFRDAAVRLHERKPFLFHPTLYCVLHSIELALKAHLAHAGITKRDLASKKLGHDLAALVKAAAEAGSLDPAIVDAHDRRAIVWGGKDYSKKTFEYPEFMVSTLPIGRWLTILRGIIKRAEALDTKA